MGEQPIFTTKAHVFQIDPNTKKKWLPASTQAVSVSYYNDSTRQSYRIISVEGSKAVINSTITPNMTFTKTSQKFGQWTDPRANTVYGLGFATEADLLKFIEKFKEVKELTRQTSNGTVSESNGSIPAPVGLPVELQQPSAPAHLTDSPVSVPATLDHNTQNELNERKNSTGSGSTEAQLKYENDRLKIALAQSSANAKKWEVELQTLKNNNVRLTTALQESTSNVEEWKKQLASYKEESARMKRRVVELEKVESMSGVDSSGQQQQVRQLTDRIQQLEITNRHKEKEISEISKKLETVKSLEGKYKQTTERLEGMEKENEQLHEELGRVTEQLGTARSAHTRDKHTLRDVHEQAAHKLTELQRLHDQMSATLLQHTPT